MAHLVTFILVTLLVNIALVNNVALVQLQSVFPVLHGNTLAITRTLSRCMLLVVPVAASISKAFSLWVLAPSNTEYLSTFALGVVVVTITPVTAEFVRQRINSPSASVHLPLSLLMANAMLLTVAGLQLQEPQQYNELASVGMAFVYGLCTAVAYAFAQEIFFALRERIDVANVPKAFAGAPLDLITVGLMALALMGLSGLTRA